MNKLVTALAALLVMVSVVAGKLWLELRDVRAQNTDLTAKVTQLQSARLAAAWAPRPPAPEAASPPTAAGQPVAPAAPRPARARAADPQAAAAVRGMMQQAMSSPETKQMTQTILRALLPQRYPGLGKALNLTPAEEQKLYDLLAKQQADSTQNALGLLGGARGDPAAAQDLQRRNQEIQKANTAELSAMLGSKYPQYQEYQNTLPTRQQVTQLQTALGTGNNALTDTQSKSLISALAAEQSRIDQATRNSTTAGAPQTAEERLQRQKDNNDRLVSVASSQLNPQQLDSYKKMLDQQQNTRSRLLTLPGARGTGAGTAMPAAPARP